MKKIEYLLGLLMLVSVSFISNSCSKDVPTYVNERTIGCTDVNLTNIKVLVCDAAQTNYFGGAEVFVYLSDAAMAADPGRTNYFMKATTDNTDPINIGAVFYKMAQQPYFFFARKDNGGGNFFTGTGKIDHLTMCTTNPVTVPIN